MTHANEAVASWLTSFSSSLAKHDFAGAADHFEKSAEGVYWRDLVSFTWNIATFEGMDSIVQAWQKTVPSREPVEGTWKVYQSASETDGEIESHFTFENKQFRGRGHVRLRNGKAWTLMTSATELVGFEEKTGSGFRREHGVIPGKYGLPEKWQDGTGDGHRGDMNWTERKAQEQAELGTTVQPYVLIVGGGQGGVALGARLRRLGVPHLVCDKVDKPGDSWRNRYRSLCLHDPVWFDHFPYMDFPDHWPVYTPKDQLGDWIESYVKLMDVNYWPRTEVKQCRYLGGKWSVNVEKDGTPMVLTPSHVVIATGLSGFPNTPDVEGQDTFGGPVFHSSKFPGGDAFAGKKAVIIGSNNSAHDIAEDLYIKGASVTMVQRSSTHIVTSDALMETALKGLYDEDTSKVQDVNTSDLTFSSIPFKVLPSLHQEVVKEQKIKDETLLKGLTKAGFMLDYGEDESGLFVKYLRRGSGYYIDVGCSQMIVDGKIKMLGSKQIKRMKPHEIEFTDGTSIPADVAIFATGYGNMNEWIGTLIDEETQHKVGRVWGLGSGTTKDPGPWEGELRNMWKPLTQENLWLHGGNLYQSRLHSLFLALQLKGRMEGLDTAVYPLPFTHHAGRAGYGIPSKL